MQRVSRNDYYLICLKFQFRKVYIIWISNEIDTVVINEWSKIVAFGDVEQVKQFALDKQITLNDGSTLYDVAVLQKWLVEPSKSVDGNLFLGLWNLFIDISESLNIPFIGDDKTEVRNSTYDKLFDLAGPFVAHDPNPFFIDEELSLLGSVMQNGLATLLNNLVLKV